MFKAQKIYRLLISFNLWNMTKDPKTKVYYPGVKAYKVLSTRLRFGNTFLMHGFLMKNYQNDYDMWNIWSDLQCVTYSFILFGFWLIKESASSLLESGIPQTVHLSESEQIIRLPLIRSFPCSIVSYFIFYELFRHPKRVFEAIYH